MLDRPLFTGSSEHSLDEKGRLVVPARFRERLGAGFFLTIAEPDPCLAIFPASTFSDVCAKIEAAAVKDEEYRDFVRRFFASTEEVSTDGNGRLVIPAPLRAYAGLEKDIVSIGAQNRVELWAKDRYDKHARERRSGRDFITELGLF
jgi:transcriptional regulator MraZ